MTALLARWIFFCRWLFVSRLGLWVGLGLLSLVGWGYFQTLSLPSRDLFKLGAVVWVVAVLVVYLLRERPRRTNNLARRLDSFELGLLLLGASYMLIQLTGGPESWAQPVAFLLVAYLVGFNERPVGLALTAVALLFQTALHLGAGQLPGSWQPLALRSAFILAFALGNLVLLQAEVARRRLDHKKRLAEEIRARQEEAREFRLISTALSSGEARKRAEEEAMLARGAVESIHQGMFFVLEMLKKSLSLQTCVLLWLDDSGERLQIKELVTDSALIREVPISAQAGALGGVIKNRLLLNLRRPPRGSRSIPYYEGPEQVGAFLGVPVIEEGHLRGVLCADRRDDRVFSEAEEQLMLEATRQVLRAIQTERVFGAVERAKYEHERFYRASTMLNTALTLSQVYDSASSAAREIAEFDFGAITLFDREKRKHIICRILGEQRERLEGQAFGDNAGLVAMVVKNKHFLPASGDVRERDTMIFTRKLRVGSFKSLVVLPLIVKDEAIGTFVLAGRNGGRFPKKVREMLGVISNQVAVSIENAKMYKRMEEMATIDGLTSLPNHRTFQARLSEMLYRAERHGKMVSVVLTDIDKFKAVNDTYGHPVGDAVLRRVSKVMAGQVRKVDLVARYGGEEFAMVLEETDGKGARLFCERVRQEVAAQLMSSDKGSFRVTISLGIATYPVDGREKKQLIDRADQALYAAKEGGRNRTILYSEAAKSHRIANG